MDVIGQVTDLQSELPDVRSRGIQLNLITAFCLVVDFYFIPECVTSKITGMPAQNVNDCVGSLFLTCNNEILH